MRVTFVEGLIPARREDNGRFSAASPGEKTTLIRSGHAGQVVFSPPVLASNRQASQCSTTC